VAQNAVVPLGRLVVNGEGLGSPTPLTWTLTRSGRTVGTGTLRPSTVQGKALGTGIRGQWSLMLTLPTVGSYRLRVAGSGTGGGIDSKDFVVLSR
jgi:hypothetical protein